jgi:hypothetical protein
MISFELFGQLAGSADPADDFFGYPVDQMADFRGAYVVISGTSGPPGRWSPDPGGW